MILVDWTWAWIKSASVLCFVVMVLVVDFDELLRSLSRLLHYDHCSTVFCDESINQLSDYKLMTPQLQPPFHLIR
jgi:hypothetical protein